MFVAVQFAGTPINPTHIRALEKFSREGPADKWMRAHPLTEVKIGGEVRRYRAVVMRLPRTFVLRNDAVKDVCRRLACSWLFGKYHVYRLAALDIVGVQQEWKEFQAPKEEHVSIEYSAVPAPTAGDPVSPGT